MTGHDALLAGDRPPPAGRGDGNTLRRAARSPRHDLARGPARATRTDPTSRDDNPAAATDGATIRAEAAWYRPAPGDSDEIAAAKANALGELRRQSLGCGGRCGAAPPSLPLRRVVAGRLAGDPPPLVFVGERRSRRAIRLGVTWDDGRLAARTLHEALAACGIDPRRHIFVNLFLDPSIAGDAPAPPAVDRAMVAQLAACAALGARLVGLGRLVQGVLAREGLPHLALVHPAARGALRRREVYHAHVAERLRGGAPAA